MGLFTRRERDGAGELGVGSGVSVDLEEKACPACRADLPPWQEACPECGAAAVARTALPPLSRPPAHLLADLDEDGAAAGDAPGEGGPASARG